MKFSHISDTHLGLIQYGLSEREQDVYDSFNQAIDISIKDKVDYGQVYITQLDLLDIGKEIFEDLYADFKSVESGQRLTSQGEMKEWQNYFTQIVSSLIFTYRQLDMESEAESILTDWLSKNPDDPVAKKLLEDLKKGSG